MSTTMWEYVLPGTYRVDVPGGWIYRVEATEAGQSDAVAFVPFEHPLVVAYPDLRSDGGSYEVGSGRDIPEAWMPSDCQDRNSCAKNGTCQYTGCSASPWHLTEDGLTHETEVAARNFDFNEQECDSPLPELRCTTCNCWKITREFSG